MNQTILDQKGYVSSESQRRIKELQAKIVHLKAYEDWMINKLEGLDNVLPDISEAFKRIGLEILSFKPRSHYGEEDDYNDTTGTLAVQFILRMTGRRKPYDKTSYLSDQERTRREKLRTKHEEQFKAVCGYNAYLNQYSLDKSDRVLVEVYFK